jgi:hypothetical protein
MVFIALMVFVGFRVARDCPEKPDPLKHQEYRFRLSLPPCPDLLLSECLGCLFAHSSASL